MRSVNPKDGSTIAEYPESTDAQLGETLTYAALTAESWRGTSVAERKRLLLATAAILRDRKEKYARLITDEMGKPIREARAEMDTCAACCEHYAAQAEALLTPELVATEAAHTSVRLDPLGVVLGVMPWSYPFAHVFRFAVPALLAGNCVLLRHSSLVTGCALAITEIFALADYPASVFSTLVVGNSRLEGIIRDPRVAGVCVVGTTHAGQAIGGAAGRVLKPCLLELGGSDPFIVLEDCDLDATVHAAVRSRIACNGQSPIAAKRFIVHSDVHDAFVERLAQAMKQLRVGDPRDEHTDVGPLAHSEFVHRLLFQIETSLDQGATRVLGGEFLPRAGNYFPPTLLTQVSQGMAVFDEETLGPVASVTRVGDDAQAVRLANASNYGLGASLWTSRERGKSVAPRLDAGYVAVNDLVKYDPRLPFGGVKMSGHGRSLSRHGVLQFANVKTVWVG